MQAHMYLYKLPFVLNTHVYAQIGICLYYESLLKDKQDVGNGACPLVRDLDS